jgi:23S rRNA (pseudouridine1915-N3)-methyltransferase
VPPVAIVELEVRQRLPARALKAREAALILEALPARARLIALDERGAMWSSRGLADRLAAWRDQGMAELAFAIGGADGLGPEVLDRADAILSLGPMTWPHLLVRSLLLEQLYRAQQILAGHPYHRK